MRRNRFQNKVATGSFTLPVASFFATLLWCADGICTLDRLWGWLLCSLITYLWLETNNTYALIRIRSMLTPSIFVFLVGTALISHNLDNGVIISCLMLASYRFLFGTYQQSNAMPHVFHAFLCIGIGSIFFPWLFYFVPFYLWYTAFFLRSLSWRTFWAAIIGLVLPYWFWSGYAFYTNSLCKLGNHFLKLGEIQPIQMKNYLHPDTLQTIFIGWLLLLIFIASIHCIRTSFNDKIRTRMFFYIILMQELLIILFMTLQPKHFQTLSTLLLMNSAPILSHYFALTSSRFSNVLFVLSCLVFISLTFLYLWMHWLIY